jgi:predicted enzyme related to lactoylglutathione lyase
MSTGPFVWYELMTTDTKAAMAFYTHAIGWKTEVFPGSENAPEPYNMWVASQGALGGVMTLPEQAKQMGAPPHWMGHVEVDDLGAAVSKVRELGGRIHVPPTEIPGVGHFSVIADPQGASLSLFKPKDKMQEHAVKPGEFCWRELMSSDAAAAMKFYSAVCGWKQLAEHDMGPMGKYLLFGQGETQYGGMMNKPKEMPVSAWGYYVDVEHLDAAIERATSRGGKLAHGPMEVPGGARVAQLFDPQGAFFAMHEQPKKK